MESSTSPDHDRAFLAGVFDDLSQWFLQGALHDDTDLLIGIAFLQLVQYRERYATNLRCELPRIPFASYVGFSTALSSRAEDERPQDGHAESRDPIPADTRQRPEKEFSLRTSSVGVHGKNSSLRRSATPSNKGSFDSAKGFASESLHSAQDDRLAGAMKDLDVFRALAKAGQRLAEIHVHYEQQPEYKLTKVEKKGEKLDYRVKKMKLSKDKTTLIYNQFLTLSGVPKEAYEYRLGNRSALEWVIDQYQVSTDKRSGITNNPNREDDREYILRLIGQVITVSLETVNIVKSLPQLVIPDAE